MAGPPSDRAMMETAMSGVAVPVMSTCPVPSLPNRAACSAVPTPLSVRAANTAQARYVSSCPALRATMDMYNTDCGRMSITP